MTNLEGRRKMFNSQRWLLAFVMLAVLFIPGTAMGQEGVLAGKVVNQQGQPIADALILVTSVARGDRRELHSNDEGNYLGRGFRPEDYRVVVTAEGYRQEATDFHIGFGMNTLDVTLSLAVVEPEIDYDNLNKLYEDSFEAFEKEDWPRARDLSAELIAGLVDLELDTPEAAKMLESSYEILGRSNLELEAYDESVAAWDAVLATNPNSVVANVWAGQAHTRRGQFEQALPYLKRAAEISPEDAAVQYNAGAVMLQLNDVEGGIAAMQRAIELRPVFPLARKNLGYAYLRNPDTYAQAVEMLRSYLEQAPADAPDRAEVEGMIAAIEAQIRQ